ncbi:MAG TPA: ice-binding family protein [Verrucomicrobiae bacterium]|nr:ice-binding family protein [Verrucomicrobiae bacterium]
MMTNHPKTQAVPFKLTLGRTLALLVIVTGAERGLFAAGPAPVDLRSTAPFAILSGAGITSTGGGTINGNVGASPIAGSAIGVTCAQVNGTIYAVDASGPACAVIDATLLTTAKGDLTTAYNDAAGRTPTPTGPNLNPGLIPGSGNIGGMNLAPGLYKFTTTALITGADVTLTGGPDDVWIFQCAQDLQLGSGIKVILAGGALAKNVFWQVGTSAVLGTSSEFKGTILADQSVTMNTSSTIEGRALASVAGVVFNGNGASVPVTPPPPVGPEIEVTQPEGVNIADAGSKDFGSVAVGSSGSLVFNIRNGGNADLTGLAVTVNGADAAMFTLTASPTSPVGGDGGNTTFTVRFAPTSAGTKTAAIQIASNDADENPFDITITGTGTGTGGGGGPEIAVEQPAGSDIGDAGSKDFGSVVTGANASLTFTIRNTGAADLSGLGMTIDGADASSFSVTGNPTAPVTPGGNTTFTVRFAPTATGAKTATLHIANNDTDENPFDITLTGVGTSTGGGAGSISVASSSPITFNPQTGLFEQTVRLNNAGPAAVTAARLLINGLPEDVQVYNKSGLTNGTPFVQHNSALAADSSVDLLIEYYRPSRQPITSPTFAAQDAAPVVVNPTGATIAIDRNVQLTNGRFLVEFSTTPGRTYAVQYSSDMTNWKTVPATIVAPANKVQWLDDGPPKTESKPTSGSRFYQVIELQ